VRVGAVVKAGSEAAGAGLHLRHSGVLHGGYRWTVPVLVAGRAAVSHSLSVDSILLGSHHLYAPNPTP